MKALSVRQPWAWLLLYGQKDVENRDWGTLYRGEIAIHAAKGMTLDEYKDAVAFVHTFNPDLAARIPAPHALVRGSILGTCQMVDCVTEHPSRWFQGLYGFVMREPRAWHKPVPARGALGLWEWTPAEMPSIKDTVGPLVCASGGLRRWLSRSHPAQQRHSLPCGTLRKPAIRTTSKLP